MQQHLRRTARGVCLLGVVAINDLDIKIAERGRGGFAEFFERKNACAEIGRLHDGDFFCRLIDQSLLCFFKAGGADQYGKGVINGELQRLRQMRRVRKIDQQIGLFPT